MNNGHLIFTLKYFVEDISEWREKPDTDVVKHKNYQSFTSDTHREEHQEENDNETSFHLSYQELCQ